MLARIGGDEFVLLLTGVPRPDQVFTVATRIIEAKRKPILVEGHHIEIAASAAIALQPNDGATTGSPATNWRFANVRGRARCFVEEGGPADNLKLVANRDLDETMLEALDDYTKR